MYISMEDFLLALHPVSPVKVEAISLNRRKVEFGLLSVGLKIHCINDGAAFGPLIEKLGGRKEVLNNLYRKEKASMCLVLPPVGSARYAILLLECIEHFTGITLFDNPEIEIQVCTPGRLGNLYTGLLTLGFYLGSDILRTCDLSELETTFSENNFIPRGKRLAIYDGQGALDQDFEVWTGTLPGYLAKMKLPLKHERTDVLMCSTRTDIENVNLIASLLTHQMHGWYWRKLGGRFIAEMTKLLQEHQLAGLLKAPWIRKKEARADDDERFLDALQEVMAYVIGELVRINQSGEERGILYDVRNLLARYRKELVDQSPAVRKGTPQ